MKLDLLTNATVVEDTIKFVSRQFKDQPKSYTSNTEEDEKSESHNQISWNGRWNSAIRKNR